MDYNQLKSDILISLKSGDTVRTQVLRTLLSDVRYSAIAKYQAEWETKVNDQDIEDVVKKQLKSHRESIEMFTKGSRDDLVQKEKAELEIIEKFLPPQMADSDLEKLVTDAVASGESNFGKLMGQIMAKTGGKADGARVAELLKKTLK